MQAQNATQALVRTAGQLSAQDIEDLRWAYRHLEHPSFAARLSSALAMPFEQLSRFLPASGYHALRVVAESSIRLALRTALASLGPTASPVSRERWHKVLAASSGAVGGFFGAAGLLGDMPLTTVLMLRSIADIARRQGEDLRTSESRLACLEVYALGGRSKEDDAAEAGYYALRASLAWHFSDVLRHHAASKLADIPAAVNVIRAVAARFGVVVTDKAAVQLVPIGGAVSGAVVNVVFMQHFQDMARGHFIVRRLERQYGADVVRAAYTRVGRGDDPRAH